MFRSATMAGRSTINNASTSSAGVTIYAICAKPLPSTMHYTIVSTAGFTDDAGTEEGVTEFCPERPPPSSVAAFSRRYRLALGQHQQHLPDHWRMASAYMNNASTFDVTVTVFAVCGV